jgi:hypothetical protein
MRRPHPSAAWLALLALALTATGAPLPFPKEVRHPVLKQLQGEWFVEGLAVDGLSAHYGTSGRSPHLVAVIQQSRITFRRDGVRIAEWSVSLSAGEMEFPKESGQGVNGYRGCPHTRLG